MPFQLQRTLRLMAMLVAVPLLGLVVVSTANADPRDPQPMRLVPAPRQDMVGPTPLLAVPQRYLCANAGTMRNAPDSFVLGWCLTGWPIDLNIAGTNGYLGWAYGNYDGCGWIYVMHIGSAQPGWNHNCTSSIAESAFMTKKNASPWNDGAPVTVKAGGCPAYLNVRPWAGGGAWNGVTGIPAGATVYWRYHARIGAYVMLRRTNDPTYTWVFVPDSCVPTPATVNPG